MEGYVMGIFDSLMQAAGHTIKTETAKAVTDVAQAIGKGQNRSESFTFTSLPTNLSELQALPEAKLDSPFKTAALTLAVLCRYKEDRDATFEMLDFLKGPENVSTYEKQFIKERLEDKFYTAISAV